MKHIKKYPENQSSSLALPLLSLLFGTAFVGGLVLSEKGKKPSLGHSSVHVAEWNDWKTIAKASDVIGFYLSASGVCCVAIKDGEEYWIRELWSNVIEDFPPARQVIKTWKEEERDEIVRKLMKDFRECFEKLFPGKTIFRLSRT